MVNFTAALVTGLYVFVCVTTLMQMHLHTTTQEMISALQDSVDMIIVEEPEPESQIIKQRDMRVTGYVPTGKKTALGENVVVGRTAAVSRNCMDLLGEKVYIEGHGIRYINDLTAQWVGEKFNICTIDLAVPTEKHAMQVGNEVREVIHIPFNETN
jgi:3D (Asp-Asp-Asp) domain-containing protein